MNLAEYYRTCSFSKTNRVVEKIDRQRVKDREEEACRAKVDARDGRRCFFPNCRLVASDKHHIVSSSVRGKRIWRTNDILSACRKHHGWFKAGLITTKGNPDRGPVAVFLTELGAKAGIRIPQRKAA